MSSPTRFTYSESPEAFTAAQRLASAQLPPHRLRTLIEIAGNPLQAIFQLSGDILRQAPYHLTEKQVERLREAEKNPLPRSLEKNALSLAVTIVTHRDLDYPEILLPLSDAPPLLFVRGDISAASGALVAIVGSRRATLYGRKQAERFARVFAETETVVVSGGAAGIDTTAHQGALDAGGRTIAVLGCGIDHAYPAENRDLFARIASEGGAVISEYPLGTLPEPWRFPARNRIIAGLSHVTVVIESPQDSGALITARCAAEYGRTVYAVPGAVDTGRSRGCHELIRDGAFIADSPEDVLFGLSSERKLPATGRPPAQRPTKAVTPEKPVTVALPPVSLTEEETRFLAQVQMTPLHLDDIGAAAGLSAAQSGVAATMLEMKAQIRRLPGNLFVRMT